MKMVKAFISLGSNINPAVNMRKAIRMLVTRTKLESISTVYCTEPLRRPEQPAYFNCVAGILTDQPPQKLKAGLLAEIENEIGRIRSEDKYAPRTIDLDLILYDDLALATDRLVLPDPDIMERPFLALGLAELEPNLMLPGAGLSAKEVAARFQNNKMKPLIDYTMQLRKEIAHGFQHGENQRTGHTVIN